MPKEIRKELDRIISGYVQNKERLDSLKKVCDTDNKEIKKLIPQLVEQVEGQDKWVYDTEDGISVVLNTTKKQTLNEDKLLDILKNSGVKIKGLIKKKEYVDLDVLEDAMYKQLIGHDLMMQIDKCRSVKETQVLTVKR